MGKTIYAVVALMLTAGAAFTLPAVATVTQYGIFSGGTRALGAASILATWLMVFFAAIASWASVFTERTSR